MEVSKQAAGWCVYVRNERGNIVRLAWGRFRFLACFRAWKLHRRFLRERAQTIQQIAARHVG